MMRAKRKLFRRKLPGLDMVLDFYPRHKEVLQRKIVRVPVLELPVNVLVERPERRPIGECEYDVCVVGQKTERRLRVYRQLDRAGLRLSPMNTSDFPAVVGRSKLVLNVRSHRYDNLEVRLRTVRSHHQPAHAAVGVDRAERVPGRRRQHVRQRPAVVRAQQLDGALFLQEHERPRHRLCIGRLPYGQLAHDVGLRHHR